MKIIENMEEELKGRIKDLEDLIEEKGIASKELKKIRKIHRNINLAVIVGSLITVAGITAWAVSSVSKKN